MNPAPRGYTSLYHMVRERGYITPKKLVHMIAEKKRKTTVEEIQMMFEWNFLCLDEFLNAVCFRGTPADAKQESNCYLVSEVSCTQICRYAIIR